MELPATVTHPQPCNNKDTLIVLWRTTWRPWLMGILGATCVLLSVTQTLSLLFKFLSCPVSTLVALQEITPAHSPWITICPSPAVNFKRLEEIFVRELNLSGPQLRNNGFSTLQLGRLAERAGGNMSYVSEKITEILLPLWKHDFLCLIGLVQFDFTTDKSPSRPDCSYINLDARRGRYKLDLTSTTPATFQTEVGSWETEVMVDMTGEPSVGVCSTFKPNITLAPNSVHFVYLRFGMTLDEYYSTHGNSSNWEGGQTPLSADMPRYKIYIRQPHEQRHVYSFAKNPGGSNAVDQGTRVIDLWLGESVDVEMKLDIYKFVSSQESQCSEDSDHMKGFPDCQLGCFEAIVFNSSCRFPGHRGNLTTAVISLEVPKECNKFADFENFRRDVHRLSQAEAGVAMDHCRKLCIKPCATYEYDMRVFWVKTYPLSPMFRARTPPDIRHLVRNSSYLETSVMLSMTSSYAKVVEQQYSYGAYAFLSELGGSWGLFLGASLVSVAAFIEYVLEKLLR